MALDPLNTQTKSKYRNVTAGFAAGMITVLFLWALRTYWHTQMQGDVEGVVAVLVNGIVGYVFTMRG